MIYSSALLWPQFFFSSASSAVTGVGIPTTPTTPRSPASMTYNRDYALTPEKEEIHHFEDMPLNLSVKRRSDSLSDYSGRFHETNSPSRTDNDNDSGDEHLSISTPPPPPSSQVLNLCDSHSKQDDQTSRGRLQSSIIWSPASMCEKEDTYRMDPLSKKFKYERRSSYSKSESSQHRSLQISPATSSLSPAANRKHQHGTDVAVAIARERSDNLAAAAHRHAFISSLSGNNNHHHQLEMLSQHLRTTPSAPQQHHHDDILLRNRIDMLGPNSRDRGTIGDLKPVHSLRSIPHNEDHSNMYDLNTNKNETRSQSHHQHQHQHPDSTAVIGVPGVKESLRDCEERRSGRNFQVSTYIKNFWVNFFFFFGNEGKTGFFLINSLDNLDSWMTPISTPF